MNDVAVLLIGFLIAIGSLIRGVRFQRGTDLGLLPLYRRAGLPAVYRNLPVVSAVLGGGLAILTVLMAPLLVDPGPQGPGARGIRGVLVFAIFGGSLVGFAALVRLLYRPPAWLVPAWLKAADTRDNYAAPPPGRFDKVALAIGMLCGVFGIGVLGSGLLTVLAGSK